MNNRIISLLSALTAIALAMAARGAFAAVGFTAPQLPESPYDDTEIATNFVISAQFDNARAFSVDLDFEAAVKQDKDHQTDGHKKVSGNKL